MTDAAEIHAPEPGVITEASEVITEEERIRRLFAGVTNGGVINSNTPSGGHATYHDFMVGKVVVMIQDDWSLRQVIDKLKQRVAQHTRQNPYKICLDTETTAIRELRLQYAAEQIKLLAVKSVFDSFPKAALCTDRQGVLRERAKDALDAARKSLNDIAKRVKKAGLNVYIGEVRLVQLYTGTKIVTVIDRWRVSEDAWLELREVLCDERVVWIGHNVQFDVKMVAQHGIVVNRAPHCTLLQDQALTSLTTIRRTLAALSERRLGKLLSKEQQTSDWSALHLDPKQIHYAASDVVTTWEVYQAQDVLLDTSKRLPIEDSRKIYNLMRGAIPAVNEIMMAGIGFNAQGHTDLAKQLKIDDAAGRAAVLLALSQHSAPGAPVVENPGSNVQVGKWLGYHLALDTSYNGGWPTTPTGQFQVGADELKLNKKFLLPQYHPVLDALIKWSKAKKDASNFGEDYQRHINPISERIHANVRIGGAETGRFSITEPALQTINRGSNFRELFVARPGYKFVVLDFGQIEVRVPTCLSSDVVLRRAIEGGLDIHSLTALACFNTHPDMAAYFDDLILKGELTEGDLFENYLKHPGLAHEIKEGRFKWMRQIAKASIFGLIFGQGPTGLMEVLATQGVFISKNEAARIQRDLLAMYPGLRQWIVNTRSDAEDTGFIWTPQGRVYAPDHTGSLYTKSINTPCQGGAAEIMLRVLHAFPKFWSQYGIDGRLVHTVHDELIAEVCEDQADKARDIMTTIMVNAACELFPTMPLKGLVSGGIGDNWATAK